MNETGLKMEYWEGGVYIPATSLEVGGDRQLYNGNSNRIEQSSIENATCS